MINSRAEGGAYHRVMVNGREWSKHTTTHKADEIAYDVGVDALRQGITPFPTIYVESAGRVYYEPDPAFGSTPIPPAPVPVLSDGGEDIVSFLHRHFTPSTIIRVPAGTTGCLYERAGVDAVLDESAAPGEWKIRTRFIEDTNGENIPFLYAWKGYGLLVHRRKKNAIRIDVGG